MNLEIGSIVEGKVKNITNFGAFLELEDGRSGLLHISEISSSYVTDVRDVLSEGQNVKVKVIGTLKNDRVSLSMRRIEENYEKSSKKVNDEFDSKKKINKYENKFKPKKKLELSGFEAMLLKFKKRSEEKMSDLKKANSIIKRGGKRKKRR
ncbi:MAG: S1 RNA-binding domain-containing protein [Oscillospiraceae bacterium]|jgi:S1 RNA binding domain protein|nr:S1 RNA-binding domain-containing protein [Oscillospiraceae bacterium]